MLAKKIIAALALSIAANPVLANPVGAFSIAISFLSKSHSDSVDITNHILRTKYIRVIFT